MLRVLTTATLVCTLACIGRVAAQPAPAAPHIDLNTYPSLGAGGGGLYDLNVAAAQNGPPGTVALTSASPPAAYSFKDVLANTHGYVETGVSSRGGYTVGGGVIIPLVPGKADLALQANTGQSGNYPVGNLKKTNVTYDTYSATLNLHPTEDTQLSLGVAGLRLHGPALFPYGP